VPETSFASLAVVLAVAFGARLALGLVPRLRVPGVVVEIVAGILVGPAVLDWADVDEPVRVLAIVGTAFVLLLAGMELDLEQLRGRVGRRSVEGLVLSLVLAVAAGWALGQADLVGDPVLAAVILSATGLGIVLGALHDAGEVATPFGRFVVAGASCGDFTAILLLSLLFSRDTTSTGTRVVLLAGFAVVVAIAGLTLARGGRSMRVSDVLLRLQDTSAQIRVRGAVLLLVALVVLAEHTGVETILGAFFAGVVVRAVDHDTLRTHPHLRTKLDAVGHGFVIPVFFVASGMRFDVDALLDEPSALGRVPLFLAALFVVRGVPALVLRRELGTQRTMAAALLQATSLPFIVTATMLGEEIGAITPTSAAAFVGAGLVSALAFPFAATALLARAPAYTVPEGGAGEAAGAKEDGDAVIEHREGPLLGRLCLPSQDWWSVPVDETEPGDAAAGTTSSNVIE
jgi:Kef-type K+ transport system membrane component KefB